MRTLSDARELKPANGRVCCAIGMFDGVHLGHQQVIRQAVSDAHQLEASSSASPLINIRPPSLPRNGRRC